MPSEENKTIQVPCILIVCKDEVVDKKGRKASDYLLRRGYKVVRATDGYMGLSILENESVDLVISDIDIPEMNGIKFVLAAKGLYPTLPFLVLVNINDKSSERAATAIKQGAFDCLVKPIKTTDVLDFMVMRALVFGRLSAENAQLREHFSEKFNFHNIVTQSPTMRKTLEDAKQVAAYPKTTISLTGESGVGKEILAMAVHCESGSGCLPNNFGAVNCAAIPETLLESELFGHSKGAFTGADKDREGKFCKARGGTVLLDEIGDMPLSLQAKLLRVLEEKYYEKVGSNKPLSVDFRVITATHRNLAEMVRKGEFREDLFYRINVVPIVIPPLRERREDIPLLVNHFLNDSREHLGKALPGISKKALDLLKSYFWPGNIRELRNMLEYAAIFVSGETIKPEHLRLQNTSPTPGTPSTKTDNFIFSIPSEDLSLKTIKSKVLGIILESCGGNITQAAKLLNIHRKNFYP